MKNLNPARLLAWRHVLLPGRYWLFSSQRKKSSRPAGRVQQILAMPVEERSPPDGQSLPPPVTGPTLPFWKTLVAGGGAGLLEIACMYPTDVSTFFIVPLTSSPFDI